MGGPSWASIFSGICMVGFGGSVIGHTITCASAKSGSMYAGFYYDDQALEKDIIKSTKKLTVIQRLQADIATLKDEKKALRADNTRVRAERTQLRNQALHLTDVNQQILSQRGPDDDGPAFARRRLE